METQRNLCFLAFLDSVSKAGRLHSGELQVPTLCQGNGEVLPGNLGTCLVLGVLKDVGVFFHGFYIIRFSW